MRTHATAALTVASLAIGSSALAHDQWLEASTTSLANGNTLDVRLFVGEAPVAQEEKVFERSKIARLSLVSRSGAVDLLPRGVDGQKPVVTATGLGTGEFLAVLDRSPVHIELEPAKFEAYLIEEGLSRIVQERATRGESSKKGRERYTRYTKTLVHTGEAVSQGLTARVLGQTLEIVIESPAHVLHAGDIISTRVTFGGKPLANAKLQATLRRSSTPVDEGVWTDAQGRAQVRLADAGFLILHLVHMRRCIDDKGGPCTDADWESFWGSFSAVVR